MKKNLILMTALFAGLMIVNDGFGFNNMGELIDFVDDNIDKSDVRMEDHLTIDALHNINAKTLIEAMDMIRRAYVSEVEKQVYEVYKTKVNKINSLIFNAVVSSEPNLDTIINYSSDPCDTHICSIMDNEFVIDFFRNPDNLSKISRNNLIILIDGLRSQQNYYSNILCSKLNVNKKNIDTFVQVITESTYTIFSKSRNEIIFRTGPNTACYFLDIYGERGLDFITESSISNLSSGDLIEFAVKMKGLHSPKADIFYNDIIKNKLKTITAEDLSYFIKSYLVKTMQGIFDVIKGIIPNFSPYELTSIVDNLP